MNSAASKDLLDAVDFSTLKDLFGAVGFSVSEDLRDSIDFLTSDTFSVPFFNPGYFSRFGKVYRLCCPVGFLAADASSCLVNVPVPTSSFVLVSPPVSKKLVASVFILATLAISITQNETIKPEIHKRYLKGTILRGYSKG